MLAEMPLGLKHPTIRTKVLESGWLWQCALLSILASFLCILCMYRIWIASFGILFFLFFVSPIPKAWEGFLQQAAFYAKGDACHISHSY